MKKVLAMSMPILPGKEEAFESWTSQLMEHYDEFVELHRKYNARERLFLQKSPQGQNTVAFFEGDDIEGYLNELANLDTEMGRIFNDMIYDLHGMRLADFDPAALPTLIMDTESKVGAY